MGANSLNVNDEKLQMSQREPESLTKQKSKETKGFQSNVGKSESEIFSLNKSKTTINTSASSRSRFDTSIEQVEKDHYLYRRGSTKVHVQAYSGSSECGITNEDENDSFNGVNMISVLLGIILFLITLTIKMATSISDKARSSVVDQYLLTLYVFGTVWTSYYLLKGFFRYQDQLKFLKTSHRSNRWLKGVIVLFGLAIILKNILSSMSYFMVVDLAQCSENNIKIAVSIFKTLFIMSQTKYIFQYSKTYIMSCCNGSRTGLMFVIAINLSTWLCTVIDEALHALHEGGESHAQSEGTTPANPTYNSTLVMPHENRAAEHGDGECTCTSDFCDAVTMAEKFLFPFLIEYSLVASSLIYITWQNVGKKPPPCERVVKPSYKFYGRYIGSSLGCIVLFLTIIFLILLSTTSSATPLPDKDYFSEYSQLFLYNCFLFIAEVLMLGANIFGFYLFYRIRRPLEKPPLLDQILLVGCVVGPIVSNLFSLIAVLSGDENRIPYWVFTLIQPLTDTLQCILQVLFVLYGLRREPITSMSSRAANDELKSGLHERFNCEDHGKDNKAFLRTRRNSLTSMVIQLAAGPEQDDNDVVDEKKERLSPPDVIISPSVEDSEETASIPSELHSNQAILKIVSEVLVARPEGLRLWLRDVMMFLLIGNACLWVFYSLSGTAFTVYQYQSLFYGGSAWTTISMICRPLTIFFRMHSAGCLFEIWSFA